VHLVPGQHIHLVGIGGFGLSAIARVLLQQGYIVSGSDKARNALVLGLEREGAIIYDGHNPRYVEGAEMLIVSSAIPAEHTEIMAAHELGIPVYKRSDIIAAIMAGQHAIAIAGTHGKTTTTAMTTHILLETNQRPSYIIGGILRNSGTNASIGTGDAFVIEADEYDNMFLGLRPQVEVVTNVEYDHPDFFPTPNSMIDAFSRFVGLLPQNGLLIVCVDDPTAAIFGRNRLVARLPVATYGIENQLAMWQAVNVRVDSGGFNTFDVIHDGRQMGTVQLALPGDHNVQNGLAALIAAHSQSVPFNEAARALKTFQGTGRRFEVRGETDGVVVIDDYAHHPTAIEATLKAVRSRFPQHEVWAVWQPHTYSRTQRLFERYLSAFDPAYADHVLITDIFAAREMPISGVNSAGVVAALAHPDAHHTPKLLDAVNLLEAQVQGPAVIIIMSAGDAPIIGVEFLKRRQQRQSVIETRESKAVSTEPAPETEETTDVPQVQVADTGDDGIDPREKTRMSPPAFMEKLREEQSKRDANDAE